MSESPQKAAPENLSVSIYSDLRMKLIIGDLKPAATLSLRTLADEYGVSAMPVREALRRLASEGALIGAAKKAYRVPHLTPAEAADLFFVRAVLEGAAAEISAELARGSDFKVLGRLVEDMDSAWVKRDAGALLLANFRFHRHIHALTGNTTLQSTIDLLFVRSGPWLAHAIINLVEHDSWIARHSDIIRALRDRDGAKARRLMEDDVRWGVQIYRQLCEDEVS
ncbi:MAG: GntR family transcriptional regulator [Paracoccaceae bacterium]|nr:GntR family transcriptional regulator [Paracoccaceae bacterium]MDE2912183.1 GntR family transcriptional regulator [Paracoccaceae bacterium]